MIRRLSSLRWAANAVHAVCNRVEMWQRDAAPMGLSRGLNKPRNQGGMMFSPPLR